MKSDLDRLMQENDLDAILVTGPAKHNPPMVYMTGGGHLTRAELIKAREELPLLYHNPMERDEAAGTGLATKNLATYKMKELLEETDGDSIQALALRYQKMLTEQGISTGRLAIYGKMDVGAGFAVFNALRERMPDLQIVGEAERKSILLRAMATKEKREIDRMREMGKITTQVVGEVADYLSSRKVKDEVLLTSGGEPLTIGEVKRRINLWLAERGAENPEGTIFAIGRDAGVPHSSGNPQDQLKLGQTIIFDIFPCEAGGGYFYDFTRTWCLGYAPEEVGTLYEDVFSVYNQIMAELSQNEPFMGVHDRTCELFKAQGHPTIKEDATIQEGFVHSVGHGLGLHLHERPFSGSTATEDDKLFPGCVVTIEPGLYYPEKGMGCRLENTVYVTQDGRFEVLVDYPMDLVLPIFGMK